MLQCVAACCSVLQSVAVCCSVLQCVVVCCSVLHCVAIIAICCNILQYVAMCCSVLQCHNIGQDFGARAVRAHPMCVEITINAHTWQLRVLSGNHPNHCNTRQHTATHCNTLQHTATHCNTLQHTATHHGKCAHLVGWKCVQKSSIFESNV